MSSNSLLTLKKGVVIMLLRNLSTANGLANGTRLFVKACFQNVIQAEILTGEGLLARRSSFPGLASRQTMNGCLSSSRGSSSLFACPSR
mmetsp:Transcript_43104/g.93678  ORF Transcript_43104/g.93678 Transcript_43104/m.93678 type:complete len:89 (+) Transcript_43104:156-422(+)